MGPRDSKVQEAILGLRANKDLLEALGKEVT